jgi:peroxiredoxin Q/BCP
MFQKSINVTALIFSATLGLSMCIGNTWADSASVRASAPDTTQQSVVPGQMAPDFKLKSETGQQISPKDYLGHWVVLYFYPKDFTKGCTIEAHNFQRDSALYAKADNAVILGVSIGTPESHQEFCTKEGLSFKLLADTAGKVSGEYGSLKNWLGYKMSARNTFIINPEGKVVRIFMGVKPQDHSAEVLAALNELQKK